MWNSSLLFALGAALSFPSPALSDQIRAWIVLPDETVLQGQADCGSPSRCEIRLDDAVSVLVGYDRSWDYLLVLVNVDGLEHLFECCEFARNEKFLNAPKNGNYTKEDVLYNYDPMIDGPTPSFGTLYLQIIE